MKNKINVHDIIKNPSLASKCDSWSEFTSWEWGLLLFDRPQFNEIATGYPSGWAALLGFEPELASKCDKWKAFNAENWHRLLSMRPEFACKCPYRIYDEFTQKDWKYLEERHAKIFESKHILSAMRKIGKLINLNI